MYIVLCCYTQIINSALYGARYYTVTLIIIMVIDCCWTNGRAHLSSSSREKDVVCWDVYTPNWYMDAVMFWMTVLCYAYSMKSTTETRCQVDLILSLLLYTMCAFRIRKWCRAGTDRVLAKFSHHPRKYHGNIKAICAHINLSQM